MKTILTQALCIALSFLGNAFSQAQKQNILSPIQPDSLKIAYSKTTNLVFPYSIKAVDRGSKDVLAQKASGLENILQIKAAQECFTETNLTVVTADGKLYSFVLNYDEQPELLNISINRDKRVAHDIFFSNENINEEALESTSKLAFHEKKQNVRVKDKKYGIKLLLNGLYIKEELMYFRIYLENSSNINYDIGQLRFFIRDDRKAKRTASQELEIEPVYTYKNSEQIKANSSNTFVLIIPKFTIPENKFLAVQLTEDSGGRNLQLKVKDRKLKKVVTLSEL